MTTVKTEELNPESTSTREDEEPPRELNTDACTKANQSSGCTSKVLALWRPLTVAIHEGILRFLLLVSLPAARNPKRTIGLISVVSLATIVAGMLTNFELAVEQDRILAPMGCRAEEHYNYRSEVADMSVEVTGSSGRPFMMMIHAEHENVVTYEAMKRLFQATNTIRSLPGYSTLCAAGGKEECRTLGPTRFWDYNETLFELDTQGSDYKVAEMISKDVFDSEGTPVPHNYMLGFLERDSSDGLIHFAQNMLQVIYIPVVEATDPEAINGTTTSDFEARAIDAFLELRDQWREEDQFYKLEFYSIRSIPDEFVRSLTNDFPLLPLAFVIMTAFTGLVFSRKHKVQSRAMLGLGSVVTIVCSIMTGFGFAFILGIPFTNLHALLPFVIFGVGLDDTFIIVGAYLPKTSTLDTVRRVEETIREIGGSIFLTTLTTTTAFAMGYFTSSIPNVRWLCVYALFAIAVDFIYQISYFVAILVLDEERIQANRRDCCICVTVQPEDSKDEELEDEPKVEDESEVKEPTDYAADKKAESNKNEMPWPNRVMQWYCTQLLRPTVKIMVLLVFTAFSGFAIYRATLLEQKFVPAEYLPMGSYASDWLESVETYSKWGVYIDVSFRDVDQSDPEVQKMMIQYLEDLSTLPQVNTTPSLCWVIDFQTLLYGTDDEDENPELSDLKSILTTGNLTFAQQMDILLAVPAIADTYGQYIARTETGEILHSRCNLLFDTFDFNSIPWQIQFLADQRQVAMETPINKGREDRFAGFLFDNFFFLLEFYTAVVGELVATTLSGIAAVAVVTFVLVPHWTGAFIVIPMMCLLYGNLLGTLQFAGMYINPVVYIALVVAIGLLVDFLIHVLLRYYESPFVDREEKVKDTLTTIGASILMGGVSTCLGVLPLAFSTSSIIQTVFVIFISIITLGITHGLILLPVILSYVGPSVYIELPHLKLEAPLSTTDNRASENETASAVKVTAEQGRIPGSKDEGASHQASLEQGEPGESRVLVRVTSLGSGDGGDLDTSSFEVEEVSV